MGPIGDNGAAGDVGDVVSIFLSKLKLKPWENGNSMFVFIRVCPSEKHYCRNNVFQDSCEGKQANICAIIFPSFSKA